MTVDIDILAKKVSEFNELKKEIDREKAEIKSNGVGSFKGSEYKAIVEERVSSKLDTDKALKVAKEIGAKWVIKEVVDETALEDSIASGEIDGSKFAVYFKDEKSNGLGRFVDDENNYLMGNFVDDKIEGFGIYSNNDGTNYNGQWSNDLQDGIGIEHWKDRSYYSGEFSEGKKNGIGYY